MTAFSTGLIPYFKTQLVEHPLFFPKFQQVVPYTASLIHENACILLPHCIFDRGNETKSNQIINHPHEYLFVRKGQFPASLGRMKKETKGQSAEIQLNRPPLSLSQTAPFL